MRKLSILFSAIALFSVAAPMSFAEEGKECKDKAHCEHGKDHKCKDCKKKCNCKHEHSEENKETK